MFVFFFEKQTRIGAFTTRALEYVRREIEYSARGGRDDAAVLTHNIVAAVGTEKRKEPMRQALMQIYDETLQRVTKYYDSHVNEGGRHHGQLVAFDAIQFLDPVFAAQLKSDSFPAIIEKLQKIPFLDFRGDYFGWK